MAVKQLSIFVENRTGTLLEITEILAAAGVDIRAMSLADTRDFGILRLIVSDIDRALEALKDNQCVVSVNEVIAVAVPDAPGSLMSVVKLLAKNQINVEYMYAFITVSGQNACVVLRVEDNAKTSELLEANGIHLVSEDDIRNI